MRGDIGVPGVSGVDDALRGGDFIASPGFRGRLQFRPELPVHFVRFAIIFIM